MGADYLTAKERRIFQRLNTPEKIQGFIDENLEYHYEDRWGSFRNVLKTGKADCFEGALFSASVLHFHGHTPHILCIEARNDADHNIALYRRNGLWGGIAQSRYKDIKYRGPTHRSIKDLVMSYQPYYCLDESDITNLTARGYSRFNLMRFGTRWLEEDDLSFVEDFLWQLKFRFLFPREDRPRFYKVDKETYNVLYIHGS